MADLVFPGVSATETLNVAYMPENRDLVIYQGDYVSFLYMCKDAGTAVDLTGKTLKAVLKTDYEDLLPVTIDVTKTAVVGEVKVYLSSALTATLISPNYIWDLQVTNAQGETRTYVTGDVVVYPQVTT